MKTIKKVEIKNFQSHQNTVIEFDEGFNVITGPSDEGKSAIVRALNWVFYNEPSGTDYIRVGASRCEVKVDFNTGYKIIRSRTPSNSRNRYELINPEGEKQVFEKVGRDVPQEIVNIHGMPKIEFDQDFKLNLNFDHQLGGAFLLNNSQANSAKVIGGLLDVHLVDSAIRETTNDITTQTRQEKQLEERKLKIEKELEQFDYLPNLATEIEKKEELLAGIQDCNSKLNSLISYQEDLKEIDKKINKHKKIRKKLINLNKVDKLLDKLKNSKVRLEKLKELNIRLKKIKKTESEVKKLLNEVENNEQVKALVIQIQDRLKQYQNLKQLESQYQKDQKRINLGQKYLKNFSGVEEAKKLRDKITQNYDKLNTLKEIEADLSKTNKSIKVNKDLINSVPTKKEEKKVKRKLEERLNDLKLLNKLKEKEKTLSLAINKKKSKVKQNKEEVKKLVAEYSELLKQAGKCPTCFSKIDDELITRLINKYKEE